MKRLFAIIIFSSLLVSCDQHGSIEAIFRLRDGSPLPSWFILPSGMTRDQVSVTMTDYEDSTAPGWKVRFVIRDKRHWFFNTIQEQMGNGYWHPDSAREKAPAAIYPHWTIIEVNGTKDVYEQSEKNDLLKIVNKPPN